MNFTPSTSRTSETLYLSAPAVVELVRRQGLRACLQGIADNIQADFLRWADFDKTARVASHSRQGVIELMPIADEVTYSFKYVNGHPGNTRLGLSTVMAFGVLADVATGMPLLLSELTLTTALRTAAMSAVAARALARPGSRSMALIGNGAQAEFQALAFHAHLDIEEIVAFDVDPAATDKLMRNLAQAAPGLRVRRAAGTREAVRGADIVTTITADKTRATILTPDLIEPGMHLNAVGGDCPGKTELDPAILARARVVVEYEPQSRIEGELQRMPADFAVTELWRVLRGEAPGRVSADEVTVFDSVGFALEDFSTLGWLREGAARLGLGSPLDLIVQPADPKDLFGELRRLQAPWPKAA